MTKQLTSTEALHAALDASQSERARWIHSAFFYSASSARAAARALDSHGDGEAAAFLRTQAELIEREGAVRVAATGRVAVEDATTEIIERPAR